jgi:hypothetical protein
MSVVKLSLLLSSMSFKEDDDVAIDAFVKKAVL